MPLLVSSTSSDGRSHPAGDPPISEWCTSPERITVRVRPLAAAMRSNKRLRSAG